jgi:hypothetical protein
MRVPIPSGTESGPQTHFRQRRSLLEGPMDLLLLCVLDGTILAWFRII